MIDQILDVAAEVFQVPRAALVGRSHARHIAQARQAVAWVLRYTYPALSLETIGQLLGGRHHTTIIWALVAAEQRAQADPDYALRLSALVPGGTR